VDENVGFKAILEWQLEFKLQMDRLSSQERYKARLDQDLELKARHERRLNSDAYVAKSLLQARLNVFESDPSFDNLVNVTGVVHSRSTYQRQPTPLYDFINDALIMCGFFYVAYKAVVFLWRLAMDQYRKCSIQA
jgi:hypothetical protein